MSVQVTLESHDGEHDPRERHGRRDEERSQGKDDAGRDYRKGFQHGGKPFQCGVDVGRQEDSFSGFTALNWCGGEDHAQDGHLRLYGRLIVSYAGRNRSADETVDRRALSL